MGLPEPPEYDDRQERWELLIPFVAVVSKGGPYPDEPFVAGVQVGKILGELGPRTIEATTIMVYRSLIERSAVARLALGSRRVHTR